MLNSYLDAKLIDYYTIRVFIFSDVQRPEKTSIKLIKNSEEIFNLHIIKRSFVNGLELYECLTEEKIELGNSYVISIDSFGKCALNVNDATSFKDFDKEYFYEKNDLGSTYFNDHTEFKVWAPLASRVVLLLKKGEEKFNSYVMERIENGVYFISIKGDLEGYKYRYKVTNSGLESITTDPYSKASSANGKDSFVINLNKTKIEKNKTKIRIYENYLNTILYELNVRDFTIDESTNIENKGKFLGLTEENKVTLKNNKCGLDYLEDLGITHVQLLPIYDFKTVDELNPDLKYNWGYDPDQYFVPEGSYSTNPDDCYSRIIECKKMIQAFHKKGIKVNMDVVFNHVYDYSQSNLETIVPNYYFRKQKNGLLSTGSGCGNELDTERLMVRKLIVDCCKYWVEEYDIDGYRFDLMGLIDIDTLKEVENITRSFKKDFMLYGEGWNLNSSLRNDKKASIDNSEKLINFAYFNDTFRNVLRGPNGFESKSKELGFLLGNNSYREGFKFVNLGSSIDYCYKHRFIYPHQSINYVECHDNCTLFDKITNCFGENVSLEEKLKIVNLINSYLTFSYGVPFFHAGQEIGLTKFGEDNTYNKGDKYNKFDWKIYDERKWMVNSLKTLFNFKKELNYIDSIDEISKGNLYYNLDNGAIAIEYQKEIVGFKNNILFIINPSNQEISFNFDKDVFEFIDFNGIISDIKINGEKIIKPRSFEGYKF